MAASNSAEVEKMALSAGVKKGGAAKGELVLAMYELANSFRNGWGIKKDPVAAKQYYETAANLGDTDAMNEVAWCYLEGFGTKKDKVSNAFHLFSPFSVLGERAVLTGRYKRLCNANGVLEWSYTMSQHHAEHFLRHKNSFFSLICWAALSRNAADNAMLRLTVQSGSVPTPRRVKGQ